MLKWLPSVDKLENTVSEDKEEKSNIVEHHECIFHILWLNSSGHIPISTKPISLHHSIIHSCSYSQLNETQIKQTKLVTSESKILTEHKNWKWVHNVRLNSVITVTSTLLVHNTVEYTDIILLKLIKLSCKDIHDNGSLCVSIAVVKWIH
jgi:hypothetical protein